MTTTLMSNPVPHAVRLSLADPPTGGARRLARQLLSHAPSLAVLDVLMRHPRQALSVDDLAALAGLKLEEAEGEVRLMARMGLLHLLAVGGKTFAQLRSRGRWAEELRLFWQWRREQLDALRRIEGELLGRGQEPGEMLTA